MKICNGNIIRSQRNKTMRLSIPEISGKLYPQNIIDMTVYDQNKDYAVDRLMWKGKISGGPNPSKRTTGCEEMLRA